MLASIFSCGSSFPDQMTSFITLIDVHVIFLFIQLCLKPGLKRCMCMCVFLFLREVLISKDSKQNQFIDGLLTEAVVFAAFSKSH